MIFQTIQSHRSLFPVKKMCRVLGVSQSGYYAWRKRVPSNRARTNIILRQRIAKLYEEHGGAAGSPMITADLRAEKQFQNISRPRVARHMRSMGLRCKTVKKFVVTTDSKHKEPVAPNILNRKFSISDSTFRLNHSKNAKNKIIPINYALAFCKTPFCIL